MKRLLFIALVLTVLFVQPEMVWAGVDTPVFMALAAVPMASGMNVIVSNLAQVTAPAANQACCAPVAVISGPTLMDFGTLTFDETYKIYRPAGGFRVDVALNGGVGNLNMTFQYLPGSSPSGAVKSMGDKVTIAFVQSIWGPYGNTETVISKTALKDVASTTINPNVFLVQGGWLTMYIGLSDGAPGNPGEPFTNLDKSGSYDAQLVITGTVT